MKLHNTPNRNASLEKASRVLSAFSEDTPELGVMDLARRVGLNKSTASRFVSTLTQLGLLERSEGGRKVRLSLRLFELGMRAARNRPLVSEAQPILQRLGDHARETAWLAIPADGDVVFVTRLTGSVDSSSIETGRRYPAAGSLGRLFAGAVPPVDTSELRKLIDRTPDVLVDHGDLIDGVTFVSGAVFDRTGRLVGALGLACRGRQRGEIAAPALVSPVRRAAADLSRRLGFLRTVEFAANERAERPSQKIA